jgi:hypothetical protein
MVDPDPITSVPGTRIETGSLLNGIYSCGFGFLPHLSAPDSWVDSLCRLVATILADIPAAGLGGLREEMQIKEHQIKSGLPRVRTTYFF